ncbi:MAG: HAD hydrolase-like protein, partial [Candidatus Omnitrophica bacterium]|nr:HAD hydrolase-like protein [Candidatus Omnitrophota bacterium]
KEVNEGANFAQLRQVYHSLILATWYKRKIKASLLGQAYVDRNKVVGLVSARGHKSYVICKKLNRPVDLITYDLRLMTVSLPDASYSPEAIWARYVEAFNKGAYNLIREEKDQVSGEVVPRKYFSGGMAFSMDEAMSVTPDERSLKKIASYFPSDRAMVVEVSTNPLDPAQNERPDGQQAPRRLTVEAGKRQLLDDLQAIREQYPRFAEMLEQGAQILEGQGADAFAPKWAEIKALADMLWERIRSINALPSFMGFTEPESKQRLDSFMQEMAAEYGADKVIVVVKNPTRGTGQEFPYSLGLSQLELMRFYESYDSQSMQSMGFTSLLSGTPDAKFWANRRDEIVEVILGRSARQVAVRGEFSAQEQEGLRQKLNGLYLGGKAPWSGLWALLEQGGYLDLDIFMTQVRHNSGLSPVDHVWLPQFLGAVPGLLDAARNDPAKILSLAASLREDAQVFRRTWSIDTFLSLIKQGADFRIRNITPSVMERVPFLKVLASEKGINFSAEIASEALLVKRCDLNWLAVLLDSLVQNAVKYTPKGGNVSVRLARRNMRHRDATQETEFAVLEVEDTGIGIPAAERTKIFSQDYRASNVGDIPGTGMGLSLSHQITQMMGGDIDVTSEVGKGSKFTVTLPLQSVSDRAMSGLDPAQWRESGDRAMLGDISSLKGADNTIVSMPQLVTGIDGEEASSKARDRLISDEDWAYLQHFGVNDEIFALAMKGVNRTLGWSSGLDEALPQFGLLQNYFESILTDTQLARKEINIFQFGLGNKFKETKDVMQALQAAFDRTWGPGRSGEWSVNFIAVDVNSSVVNNFLAEYRFSARFPMKIMVLSADMLNKKAIEQLADRYGKADLILNRHTTYGNYLSSTGALRLLDGRGEAGRSRLSDIMNVYLSTVNLLRYLARPGTRYVVEPHLSNGGRPLYIPHSSLELIRINGEDQFDQVPEGSSSGVYIIDEPQAMDREGLQGFIKNADSGLVNPMISTSDRAQAAAVDLPLRPAAEKYRFQPRSKDPLKVLVFKLDVLGRAPDQRLQELMNELRRSYHIAIVSKEGSEVVSKALKVLGLDKSIDVVYAKDSLGAGQAGPQLESIASDLGVGIRSMAYIGPEGGSAGANTINILEVDELINSLRLKLNRLNDSLIPPLRKLFLAPTTTQGAARFKRMSLLLAIYAIKSKTIWRQIRRFASAQQIDLPEMDTSIGRDEENEDEPGVGDIPEVIQIILENLAQHEYYHGLQRIYYRIYKTFEAEPRIRLEFWGPGKHPFPEEMLDKDTAGEEYRWFNPLDKPWRSYQAPQEAVTGGNQHIGVYEIFKILFFYNWGGERARMGWRLDKSSGGHFIALEFPSAAQQMTTDVQPDSAMVSATDLPLRPSAEKYNFQPRSTDPIQVIVLDVGGTIISSPELDKKKHAAYLQFCEDKGITRSEAEAQYDKLRSWSQSVRAFGLDLDAFDQRLEAIDIAEDKDPQLVAMIDKLKQRALLVAASNAGSGMVAKVLKARGLEHSFDAVYTQSTLGVGKPKVAFFQGIAEDLGVPIASIVSVGSDSSKDIAPAKALGMQGIQVGNADDLKANLLVRINRLNDYLRPWWKKLLAVPEVKEGEPNFRKRIIWVYEAGARKLLREVDAYLRREVGLSLSNDYRFDLLDAARHTMYNLREHELYFFMKWLSYRIYKADAPAPGVILEFQSPGKHPFPEAMLDPKSGGEEYRWFDSKDRPWSSSEAPPEAITGGHGHVGVSMTLDFLSRYQAPGGKVKLGFRMDKKGNHYIALFFPVGDVIGRPASTLANNAFDLAMTVDEWARRENAREFTGHADAVG